MSFKTITIEREAYKAPVCKPVDVRFEQSILSTGTPGDPEPYNDQGDF